MKVPTIAIAILAASCAAATVATPVDAVEVTSHVVACRAYEGAEDPEWWADLELPEGVSAAQVRAWSLREVAFERFAGDVVAVPCSWLSPTSSGAVRFDVTR
ncbi:MAG TPA: hypothetical protein ENK57_06445 [Polyangiaceae bacterium]|nr:hypothetical protein [Polyangiaceae bacterium]